MRDLPPTGDFQIRLAASLLRSLSFEHCLTLPDAAIQADASDAGLDGCAAGLTEWSASFNGRPVSLGWDWVLLHDGPTVLRTVSPRSNVVLLDELGYDMPHDAQSLFSVVDHILWKPTVVAALRDQSRL